MVFVTAFDHYAIKAFEVNAVDYLLKPFDQKRFRAALRRAQKAVEIGYPDGQAGANIGQLINQTRDPNSFQDRLLVRSLDKLNVIKISDIGWVESAGNYVYLHVGKKAHLYRQTMKQIEASLKDFNFIRVHRGAIVKVALVSHVKIRPSGDGVVLMEDGTKINLSRRYRANLTALGEK